MKKFSILALTLMVNTFIILPQNWNRLDMLQQDAFYFSETMQYELAAQAYTDMLEELPGNANLLFNAGYYYLSAHGMNEEAINYLEKASRNISDNWNPGSLREEKAPTEALLLLGIAYQRGNRLDEAVDAYKRFSDKLAEDDPRVIMARQHINSCYNAEAFLSEPRFVRMFNLGKEINSIASNVNPVISGDGRTMAYTSISRYGFDIFVSHRESNSWGRPSNISYQLEDDLLLTSSLSYDGKTMYLVRKAQNRSDIYYSNFKEGRWTRAGSIGRPVNSRSSETHASESPDGETLYFTSDRNGGHGELDIYRATLDRRGRWRNIENMGADINTPFNEETPFVTNDGRYLFFSSEGHNSMGGYDIFYVDLSDPSQVHNAGYPLNDTGDNLFFHPGEDGTAGYISLYREDNLGGKDIYRVILDENHELLAEYSMQEEKHYVAGMAGKADTFQVSANEIMETLAEDKTGGFTDLPSPKKEDPARNIYYRPGYGRSFNIQFLALAENINTQIIDSIAGNDAIVLFDNDRFSRFISGYYTTYEDARKVMEEKYRNAFPDAFIRINDFIPAYTIQLIATSEFIDPSEFADFNQISCIKGTDGIYRYTWGNFETRKEAASRLPGLWEAGYDDAFIRETGFKSGN